MVIHMNRVDTALAQWQAEMPSLNLETMGLVARVGHISQYISHDVLAPFFQSYQLQHGEFDVLASLRRSGEPYTLSPTQLFELLMISSGGMTNRLDRLEKAGYIERLPNPEDRRSKLVRLSPEGKVLIDEMMPAHVTNEEQALEGLSDDERQQLNQLMTRWIAHLEARQADQ